MNAAALHPSVLGVLRYFRWTHLPAPLQQISSPFAVLAVDLSERTLRGADGPETVVALRRLLEAKDAAVRAVLPSALPAPADPTYWERANDLVVELLREPRRDDP